ncbi:MAG TPA: MarR family transcriptional regulator [Chthonomonadales bacterium]|nr:MarR family transcriptional regulator [Chthonomonadales bacterium]
MLSRSAQDSTESATSQLHAMQCALFRVLKSLVFRNNPDSPLNALPISQLRCLHVVAENEGQKMLDLSHRLEIKLPALSQIVDRLVKREMLVRQTDPNDRRIVRLELTEKARTILAEAHAMRQARLEATARNLEPKAMRKVIEGLTLLAAAAERVEAQEREATPPFSPDSDPLVELMSRRARARRRNRRAEVIPIQERNRQ